MLKIPKFVRYSIVAQLEYKDIISWSCTCKLFRNALKDDTFWQLHFLNFGLSSLDGTLAPHTWKQLAFRLYNSLIIQGSEKEYHIRHMGICKICIKDGKFAYIQKIYVDNQWKAVVKIAHYDISTDNQERSKVTYWAIWHTLNLKGEESKDIMWTNDHVVVLTKTFKLLYVDEKTFEITSVVHNVKELPNRGMDSNPFIKIGYNTCDMGPFLHFQNQCAMVANNYSDLCLEDKECDFFMENVYEENYEPVFNLYRDNIYGLLALIFAETWPDEKIYNLAISHGLDINVQDSIFSPFGKTNITTPLIAACHLLDYNVVEYLLENGAKAALRDLQRCSAFETLLLENSRRDYKLVEDILQLLLKYDPSPKIRESVFLVLSRDDKYHEYQNSIPIAKFITSVAIEDKFY